MQEQTPEPIEQNTIGFHQVVGETDNLPEGLVSTNGQYPILAAPLQTIEGEFTQREPWRREKKKKPVLTDEEKQFLSLYNQFGTMRRLNRAMSKAVGTPTFTSQFYAKLAQNNLKKTQN